MAVAAVVVASTVLNGLAPFVPQIIDGLKGLWNSLKRKPSKPLSMPVIPGKSPEELRFDAQQQLGIDSINNYNFAVVGASGVGKSSLVNALCNVPDGEPRAAKTGETETTHVTTAYKSTEFESVFFWDVAGAGTTAHPLETYFLDEKLYAFDCLLLSTEARFTEIDLRIAKETRKYGVPIVCVRTKADEAIRSKRRRNTKVADVVKELKTEVENTIRPQLRDIGLADVPLYVVSAWAMTDTKLDGVDEAKFVKKIFELATEKRT